MIRIEYPFSSLVSRLRDVIDDVLRPIIPANTPVALLDFPNYPNVGDSAIWLGQAAWFAANRNRRRYVCDVDSYNPLVLRRRCPTGPILLQGGGNFGDLWPRHQHLRETVVRDFPDRPIVQLPQTIHFGDPAALARSARVFNAHRDVTILVRDRRSLAVVSNAFAARVVLCPDMAFCLTLARPGAEPTESMVFLKRTDKESSASVEVPPGVRVVDWLEDSSGVRRSFAEAVSRVMRRYPNRVAPFAPFALDSIARWRIDRGVRLLSRGQYVVTDRLHAHILCVLLGIPHRVVDNSYGKLSAFIEAWTSGSCEVSWN